MTPSTEHCQVETVGRRKRPEFAGRRAPVRETELQRTKYSHTDTQTEELRQNRQDLNKAHELRQHQILGCDTASSCKMLPRGEIG